MSERPTPETDAARAVCEANWKDGGFQGYSDDEWLAMLEKMECQRDEALAALRKMVKLITFWIDRQDRVHMSEAEWEKWYALDSSNSINTARALLARIDSDSDAGRKG